MAPAAADPHQVNDLPADASSRYVSRQPHNQALQNAWAPLAPANGQPEGHREEILPPIRGIPRSSRAQDVYHVDVAYQGIIDHHPQPFANPAYVFPEVGHAQGIQAQVQPNAPVNQERDLFGHVAQHWHVIPDPPQAAFFHPFAHDIPIPNQPRPEDFRGLASRYWYHPDAQIDMVNVEAGTTGQYIVVIRLKTPIGF